MPTPPAPQVRIAPQTATMVAWSAAARARGSRACAADFSGLFALVEDARHVLAWRAGTLQGRLVGHAWWATRWLQPQGGAPLRTAYVDAVAVEPACPGRGLGSAVLRHLNATPRRGLGSAVLRHLNATPRRGADRPDHRGGRATERVAFYERTGWERWRGPRGRRTPKPTGLILTPQDTVLVLRTPLSPPRPALCRGC